MFCCRIWILDQHSGCFQYFQSRKRLYNHKCLFVRLSVRPSAKPLNSLKSSSFIFHHSPFIIFHSSFIIIYSSFINIYSSFIIIHSSFIILHSSFIILHSSFLHFATFKLFSLFWYKYFLCLA